MAKKVRRPRRSPKPRTYAQAGKATQSPSRAQPQPPRPQDTAPGRARVSAPAPKASTTPKIKSVDFAGEYKYVVQDLQRIFLLAGVMLVVLIALNFIVQ